MKDRASALEKKFGETNRQKGRKALRTTEGACRAAVDENGNRYYYNEANETTWDPKDEVCYPTEGIKKTGNKWLEIVLVLDIKAEKNIGITLQNNFQHTIRIIQDVILTNYKSKISLDLSELFKA